MIDMHSHILPGIDDGAQVIEESIQMLQEAQEAGFTAIVTTSHYIENDNWCASKSEREELIKQLSEKIDEIDLNLKLYNGAEAYVSENLYGLIQNGNLPTICDSKYLLMELPMHSKLIYLDDIIYTLITNGITPIIAHPERYSYVQKNPKVLENIFKQGALFQANYGSIVGKYGKDAQKTVKKLLKNNMIHFLGTDAHRCNSIYTNMSEILKKIEKLIGKEQLERLSCTNAQKVLNNEDIK